MADEFCYLIKKSHAYDFQIVEFDQIKSKSDPKRPDHKSLEYMTISARGLTHFVDDEAKFMSIEEWEREVKMFHRLRKISFFVKYKMWKNFSLWKKQS